MEKINKIYHISDLHIKNNISFAEEYNHVFNNLYEYLESVKDDTSVIVITGDILHTPNNLTSESETMCVNLFSKLSSILPTIIICGNHDMHVNCDVITDSLQSLIYYRENKLQNLHYLRESGVYKFGNVNFYDTFNWLDELKNNIEKIKNENIIQNIFICKNNEYDIFNTK